MTYCSDHASALFESSTTAKEGDDNGPDGDYEDQDGSAVIDVDGCVRL